MVFAGLLLVSGSLADRFGRKKLFLIGLAAFGAGSIGAAFSGSVHLLIPFRAVMGIGAALTIPASLSIVNDIFRDPQSGPGRWCLGRHHRARYRGGPSRAACCWHGSGGVLSFWPMSPS